MQARTRTVTRTFVAPHAVSRIRRADLKNSRAFLGRLDTLGVLKATEPGRLRRGPALTAHVHPGQNQYVPHVIFLEDNARDRGIPVLSREAFDLRRKAILWRDDVALGTPVQLMDTLDADRRFEILSPLVESACVVPIFRSVPLMFGLAPFGALLFAYPEALDSAPGVSRAEMELIGYGLRVGPLFAGMNIAIQFHIFRQLVARANEYVESEMDDELDHDASIAEMNAGSPGDWFDGGSGDAPSKVLQSQDAFVGLLHAVEQHYGFTASRRGGWIECYWPQQSAELSQSLRAAFMFTDLTLFGMLYHTLGESGFHDLAAGISFGNSYT